MSNRLAEIHRRRTFAIISHPDAGKTTLTEKLLLYGGAITMAGTVKGRKAARMATSDWMALEQQRGISVTTSVMQFPYGEVLFNLLDTPGHEDFSEDTYRTLTAVDSALMVIDCAKGVETRTIKLMEVCRLRTTPIISFVNKMDRYGREPIELLDEIESVLSIQCAPITWPIGMGQEFRGIYHFTTDEIHLYQPGQGSTAKVATIIKGLDNADFDAAVTEDVAAEFREEIELVRGASHGFDADLYLAGKQTPVFFGSAINNFGVQELLDAFATYAPPPLPRETDQRTVHAEDEAFTGFVFKIQANMDPQHRDRIAFMRVCSGTYEKNMKMRHVRLGRDVSVSNAMTFMAAEKTHVDRALPGDIIGLPNHGTIKIGDTFTQKENLQFLCIPNFAPELFQRVRLRDPMKSKALLKGLLQLCEEGATQIFRPLRNNDQVIGAVGSLQFDVVKDRLLGEYNVACSYEAIPVATARWIYCDDEKMLEEFKIKNHAYLALDGSDCLTYLAPSRINLDLAMERWPGVKFAATREH